MSERIGGLTEIELQTRAKFLELGIRWVGMDVDGTTHNIRVVFDRGIADVVDILRSEAKKGSDKDVAEADLFVREVIDALKDKYGVHPGIMERAVEMLAKYLALEPENLFDLVAIDKAKERIRKIYEDPDQLPEPFEDAVRVVGILGAAIPMPPEGALIRITHADDQWDWGKEKQGFVGMYSERRCLDTTRGKADQVREMYQKGKGVDLMIGDNFFEDIWVPVIEYGKRGVLINHNNRFAGIVAKMTDAQWGQTYEAIIEGRLQIVEGIGEVPEAIGRLK